MAKFLILLFSAVLFGADVSWAQSQTLFRTYLSNRRDDAAKVLLAGSSEILTDRVREEVASGDYIEIIGRDNEANQAIDILCRLKGKNPVFVGPAGVGKTTVAEKIAVKILRREYPDTDVYKRELDNAEVIIATPSKISTLAKKGQEALAMEMYLEALLEVERTYKEQNRGKEKPLILYIDEMHSLSEEQIEAMKPFLDSRTRGIRFLGSTTSKELRLAFKQNEAMLRRLEPIGVEEMTPEQTVDLFKKSWGPKIEARYKVKFSDEAIEAAIRVAPKLKPDNARPDGPFKVLQDLAIRLHRKNKGSLVQVDDKNVYQFATDLTGLPSNPLNGKEFAGYFQKLETDLNQVVVDQPRMVHSLTEQFSDLLTESGRPRVLMMMGNTGVGKSLVGKTFALKAFGSENRFFRIDGTSLARDSEGGQLNSLFGAANGIKSADQTSGTLMEFLDDPARGKYSGVILIDEAEKMSPDSWQRFMEMFDTGRTTGGDGKVRTLSNHVIILTSNRGAQLAFPGSVNTWTEDDIRRRLESLSSGDLKDFFMQPTNGDDDFKLPPEVVNRIDEFVLAGPITRSGAVKIGRLEADNFRKMILEKFQLKLDIDPKLIEHLALTGYSVTDGARYVSRQIKQYLSKAFRDARAQFDLGKNDTLKFELYQKDPTSPVEIKIISPKGQSLTVEAPKKIYLDPLQDADLVSKLQNLPGVMHEKIIGQDMAIRSAVQSITAKMGNADRTRPLSMFLVGSTGTGKTEFGKAIAQGLYGSNSRYAVIPLGGVMSDVDLTEIFGSKPGYSGHRTMWAFEKALTENPNGGVIIFDEISNMGGNNKSLKEALFKKFYDILDEGKWVSPATGKTFDLRNYFFLFTGNDGEKLFQGIDADDLRMARWKDANTREKIRGLLRESGVPEAFLGRPDDIILMKPLLHPEAIAITQKLLKAQVDQFLAHRPGLKVEYDQNFVKQFAESFFTQDSGGRSVKSVLENRLGELLVSALLQNGYSAQNMNGMTLKLNLTDSMTKKPYWLKQNPPREVKLQVEISRSGNPVGKVESNLTEFAPVIPIQNTKQAKSTAYHEAGHAIVNEPLLTGDKLSHITIRGGSKGDLKYYGYARYEEIPELHSSPTKEAVLAEIARLTAGRAAQTLAGFSEDAGWANDLEKIRKLGARYLTTWGMEPTLWGIQIDADGNPVLNDAQKGIFDRELKKLIDQGLELSTAVLKERWPLVRSVTAELLQKGMISEERFNELRAQFDAQNTKQVSIEEFLRRQELRKVSMETGQSRAALCNSLLGNLILKGK